MQTFFIFLIFLASLYIYIPLNKRRSKFYWQSSIDRKIPLIPIFVYPYYFYLFYLPFAVFFVFLVSKSLFVRFLLAYITANSAAAVFWYFFPNGIKRPRIRRGGFYFSLVRDLYYHDKYDTNAFPSNHVYGSIISSYYLTLALPPLSLVFVTIGFLITISTILVKQHHILDLVGGILWAVGAILVVMFLL